MEMAFVGYVVNCDTFANSRSPLYCFNFTKNCRWRLVPINDGAITFIIMTTWRRGRELLLNKLQSDTMPLDYLLRA